MEMLARDKARTLECRADIIAHALTMDPAESSDFSVCSVLEAAASASRDVFDFDWNVCEGNDCPNCGSNCV